MVHDTSGGGKDNITKLTGRKQLNDPLFHIRKTDVVTGRDASSFIDAARELNDDLARAVVIDLFELANVAYRSAYISIWSQIWVSTE